MAWFRMLDLPDAPSRPALQIARDEAKRWNTPELGYGIFATVNSFVGARRKDQLERINAWAVDMDEGGKPAMNRRLLGSPLIPSLIVETKRGYQAYWRAEEGARSACWNAIVLERLVPYFGADKNARDLCRILRVPGYLHLKDPADPFLVRVVHRWDVTYSERQLADAFTWVPDKQVHDQALREAQRASEMEARAKAREAAIALGQVPTETLWEAVWNLDCEEGLSRLSGHWSVSGERYTFRPAPRGHMNIYVDGKSSSCFIDENKKIGSLAGGGPTLAQWLRYFKHDWKVVVQVLRELFPRLAEIDDAAKKTRRS